MKQILAVVGLAATLAGCNTKRVDEMSYSEVNALAAVINKRCEDQGAKYPSREWEICVQQEATREKTTRALNSERAAKLAAGIGAGLGSVSDGYYRAAATYSTPMPNVGTNTVTCTTVPAPTGMTSYRCR